MRAPGAILMLAALAALCGCATLPDGRPGGEHVTMRPGWERVRSSAIAAARDPWVWGPLIGAAAFQIDHLDQRTSDWARAHTPVFGSQGGAENWSDDLRSATSVANLLTLALEPDGHDGTGWFRAKARATMVDLLAVGSTTLVTKELKAATDRLRPNEASESSFPSGHASSAAAHARLASLHLDCIEMNPGARRVLDAGLTAMTVGTAWARVEAGWHYPSDVLAGMALGNYLASFVNGALRDRPDAAQAVAIVFTDGGANLQWRWRF